MTVDAGASSERLQPACCAVRCQGDRPMRFRPCARLSEPTVLTTDHFQMLQRFGAYLEAVTLLERLRR
jgi:hypothetical protein